MLHHVEVDMCWQDGHGCGARSWKKLHWEEMRSMQVVVAEHGITVGVQEACMRRKSGMHRVG